MPWLFMRLIISDTKYFLSLYSDSRKMLYFVTYVKFGLNVVLIVIMLKINLSQFIKFLIYMTRKNSMNCDKFDNLYYYYSLLNYFICNNCHIKLPCPLSPSICTHCVSSPNVAKHKTVTIYHDPLCVTLPRKICT